MIGTNTKIVNMIRFGADHQRGGAAVAAAGAPPAQRRGADVCE